MSDADAWRNRTDEEVAKAAAQLTDFTEAGERAIRAELRRRGMAEPPKTDRPTVEPASPVVDRYRDAYRLAAAIVGLGTTIKVMGWVLAGIMAIGALRSGDGPLGNQAAVAGVLVAAIVAVLFWVCGVLVTAGGEILRATLDTAVASSPFLNDPQRAEAMGLPRGVVNRLRDKPGREVQ